MFINKLSKTAGISVHTIRYYLKMGLINETLENKSTTNNYKQFNDTEIEKLFFIELAKKVGYSLEETQKLISLIFQDKSSKKKNNAVESEILKIDEKIENLKTIKRKLKKVL